MANLHDEKGFQFREPRSAYTVQASRDNGVVKRMAGERKRFVFKTRTEGDPSSATSSWRRSTSCVSGIQAARSLRGMKSRLLPHTPTVCLAAAVAPLFATVASSAVIALSTCRSSSGSGMQRRPMQPKYDRHLRTAAMPEKPGGAGEGLESSLRPRNEEARGDDRGLRRVSGSYCGLV
jgi:hypothetical protein